MSDLGRDRVELLLAEVKADHTLYLTITMPEPPAPPGSDALFPPPP
jgi:hypothetical protein